MILVILPEIYDLTNSLLFLSRYMSNTHLVDVTEIFNMLHKEKKQRLFKLFYLVFLLFLSIFWYCGWESCMSSLKYSFAIGSVLLTFFHPHLQDDSECIGRPWVIRTIAASTDCLPEVFSAVNYCHVWWVSTKLLLFTTFIPLQLM